MIHRVKSNKNSFSLLFLFSLLVSFTIPSTHYAQNVIIVDSESNDEPEIRTEEEYRYKRQQKFSNEEFIKQEPIFQTPKKPVILLPKAKQKESVIVVQPSSPVILPPAQQVIPQSSSGTATGSGSSASGVVNQAPIIVPSSPSSTTMTINNNNTNTLPSSAPSTAETGIEKMKKTKNYLIPMIGIGFSSIAASQESGVVSLRTESSNGLNLGVTIGTFLQENLSLESGLFYSRKAFYLYDLLHTISFLEIPAIARLHLGPIFSIGAGMYGAFVVGKLRIEDPITGQVGTYNFNYLDFREFDFGLITSARASFPVAESVNLILDLSYQLGLSNLSRDESFSMKFRNVRILGGASVGF